MIKQYSSAICEMEKLLTMRMEDQIKKQALLNLMTVQAKARSLFEAVEGKYSDPNVTFLTGHGYKACASFYNVIVSGEAASVDTKAAEVYPEVVV
jgi:hypothetical protein